MGRCDGLLRGAAGNPFKSLAGAKKHEREVRYFKKH